MNFKELQNNFKIRYNTNIPPKCTFVGKPLFLLGDVICNFDFPSLSTALSVGTALAFDISADNSNHIQENNNNLCYSCKSGNGSGYHTENYSKTIFKTIDKLESDFNISFSGLNMLFSHTAAQRQFHNFLAPLLSALYLTFLPDTPLSSFIPVFSSDLSPREINGIFTSLISYQNSCILINSISDYNQYIFPMESKKIIIIKISEKKHYLSAEIKNALNSYIGAGFAPKSLIMSGGAAKSPIWRQIAASIMDVPVEIVANADACSVGAAIMAGVSSGMLESYEAAGEKFNKHTAVEADSELVKLYKEKEQIWMKGYQMLKNS